MTPDPANEAVRERLCQLVAEGKTAKQIQLRLIREYLDVPMARIEDAVRVGQLLNRKAA